MERPPGVPKLTLRNIVRGMLRGAARVGGGMERIDGGQHRIAEAISTMGLSQSVEIGPLQVHAPSEQDAANNSPPDRPE